MKLTPTGCIMRCRQKRQAALDRRGFVSAQAELRVLHLRARALGFKDAHEALSVLREGRAA